MAVLVLCAHPDDEVFGLGGTIAKYVKEGQTVVAVIFSSGEMTHPWLKRDIISRMRKRETEEADKILGISKTIFLGLPDGKVGEQFRKRKLQDRIIKLIDEVNPDKIFTHSIDDPHPDHQAVYEIALRLVRKIKFKGDVYSFDVWNPVNIRNRNLPRMYVNVSETFKLKIEALKLMKTQKVTLFQLLPTVYFRALRDGFVNNCKFAERFVKIK